MPMIWSASWDTMMRRRLRIFLHLTRPGFTATEGCITLTLDDMLLRLAGPGSAIEIKL